MNAMFVKEAYSPAIGRMVSERWSNIMNYKLTVCSSELLASAKGEGAAQGVRMDALGTWLNGSCTFAWLHSEVTLLCRFCGRPENDSIEHAVTPCSVLAEALDTCS
jgi:hypothetical protein